MTPRTLSLISLLIGFAAAIFPHSVAFADSPQPIGYYCNPDSASIVDGQYYQPQADPCIYQSAAISGFKVGDVYRGTVGSSTRVIGHGLRNSGNSFQFGDVSSMQAAGIQQGEDMFVAIWQERCCIFDDTTKFRDFFATGNTPAPHQNYGVLTFKYGIPPPPTPVGCTVNCFSNVLFLPGVEASRLYGDDGSGEKRLWEPARPSDAAELEMNSDGASKRSDIYTRDVLDNAYVPGKGNVYKSFIADMDALKSTDTINDWEAAPYDWRLSMDQVLNSGKQTGQNISYLSATATPFIEQELRHLAATSKSRKVTIVAHSNGGLVARALMQKLGDTETAQLIDKVILVASPQIGTPQAIAGLLHGADQVLPVGFACDNPFSPTTCALDAATARKIGDTMPGMYGLLPSAAYFTSVTNPVITFGSSSLPDWAGKYGETIHSQSAQHAFLSDIERIQPSASDLFNPTVLNDNVLTAAEAMHQAIDAWTPPSGVQVIQIAGWGIPKTVSGIKYVRTFNEGILTVYPYPDFTIDGDGTVVVPSALWTSTSVEAQDYWLDLNKYNRRFTNTASFGLLSINHGSIFEVPQLRTFVNDIIEASIKPLENYTYLFTKAPPSNQTRLTYALHSPLTLNLYDNQGHHTGVSTTTGEVDEEIPGTYYTELAGVKYIFSDESSSARIIMNGYANGTFTFNIDEFLGDTHVASTTFANIPTTPQTIATLDVSSDISTISPLSVDTDSNGSPDIVLAPKLNDVTAPDATPPTTSASIVGTAGNNGWYTSDVIVTLSVTDTESGIKETYFSLDGTATTTGNTISISLEGIHKLSFYSEDNAGNQEDATTAIVKIDKTPPEAFFSFNPSQKALVIKGVDTMSSTTVVTTSATTTIEDLAGHALQVVYSKLVPTGSQVTANIAKLSYDNGTAIVPPVNTLTYSWTVQKRGGATLLDEKSTKYLQSYLRGQYSSTLNTTTLSVNLASDNPKKAKQYILPGLIIIYEQTNKGKIISGY